MVIAPWARSASGTSEPTGSSGEMRPSCIARPNISEVTDLAIDQLSNVVRRGWRAPARSSPTRHPWR